MPALSTRDKQAANSINTWKYFLPRSLPLLLRFLVQFKTTGCFDPPTRQPSSLLASLLFFAILPPHTIACPTRTHM